MDAESPEVKIAELAELVALDKVIREAKFSECPSDPAIATSPIVAELARRVRAALDFRNVGVTNTSDEKGMIDPGWREWAVSVEQTRKMTKWHTWDQQTKARVVRDMLSPFSVSDENVVRFVNEVDSLPRAQDSG